MILAKSVSPLRPQHRGHPQLHPGTADLGIPVVFEGANINSIYPESEFPITLHGAFAQAESESTSSRARWGKRQAMKSGHVTMQYKQPLGMRRARTASQGSFRSRRRRCASSMTATWPGTASGRSRRPLEGREIPTAPGKKEWMASPYPEHPDQREILRGRPAPENLHPGLHQQEGNPQYRTAPPKYLIQTTMRVSSVGETFDAVQLEMAWRNAKAGATRKSTPTGRGKYSGKHVLQQPAVLRGVRSPTGGACGLSAESSAPYGGVSAAWTMGRSSAPSPPPGRGTAPAGHPGRRQCRHAGSRHPGPAAYRRHGVELAPMLGESMSLADIDRALEELGSQFNSLLAEASANPAEDYTERFRELSESTAVSKRTEGTDGGCLPGTRERLQKPPGGGFGRHGAHDGGADRVGREVVHQPLEKVTVLPWRRSG